MTTMTATHGFGHGNHRRFNLRAWLVQAIATHRQRIKLEELDAHLLEDIGLDRAAALREAHRPFWELP